MFSGRFGTPRLWALDPKPLLRSVFSGFWVWLRKEGSSKFLFLGLEPKILSELIPGGDKKVFLRGKVYFIVFVARQFDELTI